MLEIALKKEREKNFAKEGVAHYQSSPSGALGKRGSVASSTSPSIVDGIATSKSSTTSSSPVAHSDDDAIFADISGKQARSRSSIERREKSRTVPAEVFNGQSPYLFIFLSTDFVNTLR